MKFVDVKNDVAFHKIFGNGNKTEALISFLNAVFFHRVAKVSKRVTPIGKHDRQVDIFH